MEDYLWRTIYRGQFIQDNYGGLFIEDYLQRTIYRGLFMEDNFIEDNYGRQNDGNFFMALNENMEMSEKRGFC